jgi:hypothetical protein
MHRPAQNRSGFLIALTVVALGAITTASAADQNGRAGILIAAAPGDQAGELDAAKLPPSTPEQLGVSQHLKQIGAIFYGAWWCPACLRQKALFGREASAQLPYLECDKEASDRDRCVAAEVKAFPTWVLKGKERLIGVQSLEELKTWSGYKTQP